MIYTQAPSFQRSSHSTGLVQSSMNEHDAFQIFYNNLTSLVDEDEEESLEGESFQSHMDNNNRKVMERNDDNLKQFKSHFDGDNREAMEKSGIFLQQYHQPSVKLDSHIQDASMTQYTPSDDYLRRIMTNELNKARHPEEKILKLTSNNHCSGRKTWLHNYQCLIQYKKYNGHCNVLQRYTPNKKLGTWVNNQRTEYRKLMNGQKSSMTKERITALEEIGFEWNVDFEKKWRQRYLELVTFQEMYGHCNVPYQYKKNKQLANWVNTQRAHYKLRHEGKKNYISDERIEVLNKIGFQWSKHSFS